MTEIDAAFAEKLVSDIASMAPGVTQFAFAVDEFFGDGNYDFVSFQHGTEEDSFVIVAGGVGSTNLAAVRLTRADMHRLHAALGEQLGLTTPTPTSPVTASVARAHG